jgi:hypothetical protein
MRGGCGRSSAYVYLLISEFSLSIISGYSWIFESDVEGWVEGLVHLRRFGLLRAPGSLKF